VEGDMFVIFRNFDERKIVYTGSYDPKSLLKWLEFYSVPIYSLNQQKYHSSTFDKGLPTVFLFTKVDGTDYEK
jgi:hypothetical protein